MNNNNDLLEMQKDVKRMLRTEKQIKKSLKENNYSKNILNKIETHFKNDEPVINFYDKIKYRGTSVIGLNFHSDKYRNRFYSRNKINKIGNDLSTFLADNGVHGKLSNALDFPFGWKSGMFNNIGEDVILADVDRYLEFYEEPKYYNHFQFYLILNSRPEGGSDHKFNDCLFDCLHLYLYDRNPWDKPEQLKKYLKLQRFDKIPISCIPEIEKKLKSYAINVRGDHVYSSTVQSNKVINLNLSKEHYTIDRDVDNCKCKDFS